MEDVNQVRFRRQAKVWLTEIFRQGSLPHVELRVCTVTLPFTWVCPLYILRRWAYLAAIATTPRSFIHTYTIPRKITETDTDKRNVDDVTINYQLYFEIDLLSFLTTSDLRAQRCAQRRPRYSSSSSLYPQKRHCRTMRLQVLIAVLTLAGVCDATHLSSARLSQVYDKMNSFAKYSYVPCALSPSSP